MSASNNPVMKRVEAMREAWMQATESPDVRLLVWRIPANADRMFAAFVEAQQHPGDWNTPDFFLRLDAPFETGFGYSRALKQELERGYFDSIDAFKEQGIAADWIGVHDTQPDSAAGFVAQLASFAQHHGKHLRHVAAVLMPASVVSDAALEAWLDAALRAPVPPSLRLVLVDDAQACRWQALVERHGALARVIEAPIDLFDIARETAAQAGGAGPTTAYRQMLTDVMTLLERGSAAQTAARAEKALVLAQREQWPDQQVVLHMAVAGAHLKEQQHAEAIGRYRRARDCALQAELARHPAAGSLVMQSWFGEAGAWLVARQPSRAAQAYVHGAEAARRVPNAMFVIEGYRMAGFCLAQDRHVEGAREHLLRALQEAKAVAPAERAMTTLPLVLQDLLRLQDAPRTERLERCASDYQAATAQAHGHAEQQAGKLGDRPAPAALERIEADLLEALERCFARFGHERERLVAGGDEFFRKVVAVGRDFLHPAWNGLPEVKHPLDKELPEWRQPPQFALLPDPDPLFLDQPQAGTPEPVPMPAVTEGVA
ncbi:hypothetical protein ACFQZQ_04745 [Lysobacter koreensis]|uniref:Tetratricopeptide repeat protein n=1 Tax=Lysobacter koreensis TaxID=266122 RepID=A0ABW2YJP0_9GAMM